MTEFAAGWRYFDIGAFGHGALFVIGFFAALTLFQVMQLLLVVALVRMARHL